MDFGSRIFFTALNNFGHSTGSTANANQRQRAVLLKPRILVQAAHNEGAQIVVHIGCHFVANIEHARGVHRTQGHGNAFHQLAVLEQNQLRTAAAQVKNNTIFYVQGIDNAQIANISLRLAGNNVQLNASFLRHLGHQLRAVRGIANSRCSHGNSFIGLIHLTHVSKAAHRIDGAGKGFLRQHISIIHLLAQTQCFLLVINHVIGSTFVDMANHQTSRVGANIYDCYSLHILPPPRSPHLT